MPQAPYIPARDADFDSWLLNFTTLLTAAPTTYGLTAPDAVTCAAEYTNWHAKYLLATDPVTRTSPTVADKDAARAQAEAVIRPYAVEISRNSAVSPGDKTAIGVNLPNYSPVPIPPPTVSPTLSLKSAEPLLHRLAYKDTSLGSTKAKPYGSIGIEIWRAIGTSPAIDPAQASYYGTWTKSPNISNFEPAQVGKVCTYYARFVTRSGPLGVSQTGPWSAALSLIVM